MNTELLNANRSKLEGVAFIMGYTLDAKHDEGSYTVVKLIPNNKALPVILLDAFTYGAQKGRGRACVLLPVDKWGHPVKGRFPMPECTFSFDKASKAIASQLSRLLQSDAYTDALRETDKRHTNHEQRVSLAVSIAEAMKDGEQYVVTGRFARKSDDGFVMSSGLLIYDTVEGLELPPEKPTKRRR